MKITRKLNHPSHALGPSHAFIFSLATKDVVVAVAAAKVVASKVFVEVEVAVELVVGHCKGRLACMEYMESRYMARKDNCNHQVSYLHPDLV